MEKKELAMESHKLLYKELHRLKTAKSRAEEKPGASPEEIRNLDKKIAIIDWLIDLVTKEV